MFDFPVDIGETEVTALEFVGKSFVVEAELVYDGGLEVVDGNWIAITLLDL